MQLSLLAQKDSSSIQEANLPKQEAIVSIKKDSVLLKGSVGKQKIRDSLQIDSTRKQLQQQILVSRKDTGTYARLLYGKYLPFQSLAIEQFSQERNAQSQELLFYILTALVGVLSAIRLIFPKYFKNLFLLVRQTSVRQKQTREQLLQNNLATILLNFLFLATAGIYVSLLLQQKHLVNLPFYQLVSYSCLLLLVVYLGKFLFLSFSGWVFNVGEATNAYAFIVFLVNKVMGIILIPFVLVLTYSPEPLVQVATTLSLGICSILFLYRYLIGFGAIRNNLKVSALHFFLYLCAVEILPLVLIYKLLLDNLAGSI